MPVLLSTGRVLFTRQKIKKWWCSWWIRETVLRCCRRGLMMAIRRYHQKKIQVPFMLTPPVAKIGANSGQQVKIKIMPNKLPTNKESIFYLNVLDIPPNSPEQEGKNALKFAMQNRIKLFYRPAGIAPVNKATFKKLLVNRSGNGLVIKMTQQIG